MSALYTVEYLSGESGMKIELYEIAIKEIAEQYMYNQEEGVIGYHGKLNIRPKYQREFVYDPNANELWTYFQNVINWVMLTFPKYRKEMKGIDWGKLYDAYGTNLYDTAELEKRIADLMMDDDVTNKKGIYEFVLSGTERCLHIRAFTESQKRRMYEYQKGICNMCHKHFAYEKMQGDHITPWSKGGKTVDDNLQMLCEDCNRKKLNM